MPALHAFTDSSYGPHLRQRYDLFVPTDADRCPTVICLPGGWWTSGDHHDLRGVALRLAEAGWAAASIGTRLLQKDLKSGTELIADVNMAGRRRGEAYGYSHAWAVDEASGINKADRRRICFAT